MIEGARLQEDGPDGRYIVLDSDEGTRVEGPFTDEALRELDKSMDSFRMAELEREVVRREREAFRAARPESWDPFASAAEAFACRDPEGDFYELMRETGDALRKQRLERGDEGRDYGDEDVAA